MTSPLTCELVTEFSRLERLAPEWRRLYAVADPPGGVFQSWGWARAFWKTHGDVLTLCTPVVFAGGDLVGVLPLAMRGQTLRLLGTPYTDYNGLLCRPDDAAAVMTVALAALVDAPLAWNECVLEGIPEASPLIRDGVSPPVRLRSREQVVWGSACPTAMNEAGDVFDRLSRKESLRRHEKRLSRRGHLRFRHIEDRSEILPHLDRLIGFHVARHAANDTRSPLAEPAARAMLDGLVAELDPAGELRMSVLEVDDRPVAYHFGFQHGRRFTYYIPAFDIELRDDGPGEVMLRHLLQYAHEQRLQEFDFTVGDEQYKSRFATHVRRTFTVYVYRYPHEPRTEIRRLARRVRDAARRRPAVVAYARPAIRALRRFSERVHARHP